MLYHGDKWFIQCLHFLIKFSAGYTKVDSLLHFFSFLNYSGNPMQNSSLFTFSFLTQLIVQGAHMSICIYFYFMFKKFSVFNLLMGSILTFFSRIVSLFHLYVSSVIPKQYY